MIFKIEAGLESADEQDEQVNELEDAVQENEEA